jgi:hypothetical protein
MSLIVPPRYINPPDCLLFTDSHILCPNAHFGDMKSHSNSANQARPADNLIWAGWRCVALRYRCWTTWLGTQVLREDSSISLAVAPFCT